LNSLGINGIGATPSPETFASVADIMRVSDPDEVVRSMNDSPFDVTTSV